MRGSELEGHRFVEDVGANGKRGATILLKGVLSTEERGKGICGGRCSAGREKNGLVA